MRGTVGGALGQRTLDVGRLGGNAALFPSRCWHWEHGLIAAVLGGLWLLVREGVSTQDGLQRCVLSSVERAPWELGTSTL